MSMSIPTDESPLTIIEQLKTRVLTTDQMNCTFERATACTLQLVDFFNIDFYLVD